MKRILFTIAVLFCWVVVAKAQISPRTDSIFNALQLKFSPQALAEAKHDYEVANDTIKAIMLKVYSLPMSSRAELIQNYEEHSDDINKLVKEFNKAIPKGYAVSLEIRTKQDIKKDGIEGKIKAALEEFTKAFA